jgi:Flp pilus assembly pilin Flp
MMLPRPAGSPASLRSQAGQAMTEYIVLVVAVFIGLIPVMGALQEAFERYYAFAATWISLPIP